MTAAGAPEDSGGSDEIKPTRLHASTSAPITTSEAPINTITCQKGQLSRLPYAIELFSECAAIHGYSEPVTRYSRHNPNPRKASGTRSTTGAEPTCTPPNSSPVMIAAGQVPLQLRSAVKMKPRNRNSSQIGATTHVSAALSRSSVVPSLAPNCSSS